MNLVDMSVTDFTLETASSSPAPGGGSVSALVGSLASSLGQMVLELTVGKKAFLNLPEMRQQRLCEIQTELAQLRLELLKCVDEDTKAFNGFMAALSLPKGTDEEKELRYKAMQEATVKAIDVPYKTACLCCQVLQFLLDIVDDGNKNAISDLGVAALMARSAGLGALFNVRINLLGLDNLQEKQKHVDECDELEQQITKQELAVLNCVREKLY